METETLEKKIANLPDELKFKVEGFVDALLMMAPNAGAHPNEEVKNASVLKLKREFGALKGFVTYMADDFDAPLEEFKDYM